MLLRPCLTATLCLQTLLLLFVPVWGQSGIPEKNNRRTPLVNAVDRAMDSIVNLRGRKTIHDSKDSMGNDKEIKHVNGMGTGVVIDSRGYVLTNYHVVQDVRKIQVTTGTKESTTAQLIAHDKETDLAILKIETRNPLPVITAGTSSDLMLAETVAAIGNAYGYEHTVTVGIISQLGRTVRVNEKQVYRNLIQTDSSINPGNSGGPLLNLDGEMIGINVAVRVGAQGIAFAIPVNDALEVAARMIDEMVGEGIAHGMTVQTIHEHDVAQAVITHVAIGSPAAKAGIRKGDRVVEAGGMQVERALDFQRSMLGVNEETNFPIVIRRGKERRDLSVALESSGRQVDTLAWNLLGIRVESVSPEEMVNRHPNYQSGLRITKVRSGSPADESHMIKGDILVAMHGWKTETLDNLSYVLQQEDIRTEEQFMFYILRDQERFFGHLRLTDINRTASK